MSPPAARAEDDRRRETELLDQSSGVVGLAADRHHLVLRERRASRAAAAVVGDGRELVGESLGGAREVAGVAARARDEDDGRPGSADLVVQIGENGGGGRHVSDAKPAAPACHRVNSPSHSTRSWRIANMAAPTRVDTPAFA